MPTINLPEIKTKSLLWVNRPEASSAKGEVFYFSDIGPNGSYWISNGEFWSPLNGEVTLFSSGLDVALTGTTTETALGTYTLPGGLMSRVGQIDVVLFGNVTNNANNKTIRVRHSDVGSAAGPIYYNAILTTVLAVQGFCSIKAANSINAQKGFQGSAVGLGLIGFPLISDTRNMNLPSDITISGQLASAADTITIKGYYIIYRG